MNTSLRLAFGYKAGVGKDTAVTYLVDKYGGKHLKFADSLYDILYYSQRVCGFEEIKDRKFLQWVGTEWARAKDPDVWVKKLLSQVKKIQNISNIFISDLRFPNEFLALKKAGFKLIKIESERTRDIDHISEISLDNEDDWDFIIENNGSKSELFDKIEIVLKQLKPTDMKT